ncbi:hypothetical protein B7486_79040, partial [cyanobacterium TDX16]
ALDDAALDRLFTGLESGQIESGVLAIDGQAYQVVAAPVNAPVLIGWVVFAERLDAAQMRNLEQLSAIPLSAAVVLNRVSAPTGDGPITVRTPDGPSMRLDRPLPSFDKAAPADLVLTYPLKRAMRPYEALFWWLAAIGVAGLALLMGGTWALSRGLTRPISALDEAVHR